ncbi:MAG: aspartate/glutamate racemase family protein, partial [Candidatus Omnitrophica bacterium]|nr:aspartate/glutamate racemase family protein [Candidatus Omnitrophota bacterium]
VMYYLDDLLQHHSNGLLPEAKLFISSYLQAYRITGETTMSICISLWHGQKKYPDAPLGRGWLRTKVTQFFDEFLAVNPRLKGEIIFVNDGDDSQENLPMTADVIRGLLEADEGYKNIRQNIHLLKLSSTDKKALGSQKHGALAVGMRYAVDRGRNVVMYSDGDPSAHLALSGLLVGPIVRAETEVTVGSIRHEDAVVTNRKALRSMGTPVYVGFVKTILGHAVEGIRDMQRSFKAFNGRALSGILPVSVSSLKQDGTATVIHEPDFVYDFSADAEWVGRAKALGCRVMEVPIVWVDAPETSTIRFGKSARTMVQSLFRVRKDLELFKRRLSATDQFMVNAAPRVIVASDMDLTLLNSDKDFSETLDDRSSLKEVIGRLLQKRMLLALISGSSMEDEPRKTGMKTRFVNAVSLPLRKNFLAMASDGGDSYRFSDAGLPQPLDIGCRLSHKETLVAQSILEEAKARYLERVAHSQEEYRRVYDKFDFTKYGLPSVVVKGGWMDGSSGKVTLSWIPTVKGISGKNTDPLAQKIRHGQVPDERHQIMEIAGKLALERQINIPVGISGAGTVEIKRASKRLALQNLSAAWPGVPVMYLGDSFDPEGNDYSVVGLRHVIIINVGEPVSEPGVLTIGGGVKSGEEILRMVDSLLAEDNTRFDKQAFLKKFAVRMFNPSAETLDVPQQKKTPEGKPLYMHPVTVAASFAMTLVSVDPSGVATTGALLLAAVLMGALVWGVVKSMRKTASQDKQPTRTSLLGRFWGILIPSRVTRIKLGSSRKIRVAISWFLQCILHAGSSWSARIIGSIQKRLWPHATPIRFVSYNTVVALARHVPREVLSSILFDLADMLRRVTLEIFLPNQGANSHRNRFVVWKTLLMTRCLPVMIGSGRRALWSHRWFSNKAACVKCLVEKAGCDEERAMMFASMLEGMAHATSDFDAANQVSKAYFRYASKVFPKAPWEPIGSSLGMQLNKNRKQVRAWLLERQTPETLVGMSFDEFVSLVRAFLSSRAEIKAIDIDDSLLAGLFELTKDAPMASLCDELVRLMDVARSTQRVLAEHVVEGLTNAGMQERVPTSLQIFFDKTLPMAMRMKDRTLGVNYAEYALCVAQNEDLIETSYFDEIYTVLLETEQVSGSCARLAAAAAPDTVVGDKYFRVRAYAEPVKTDEERVLLEERLVKMVAEHGAVDIVFDKTVFVEGLRRRLLMTIRKIEAGIPMEKVLLEAASRFAVAKVQGLEGKLDKELKKLQSAVHIMAGKEKIDAVNEYLRRHQTAMERFFEGIELKDDSSLSFVRQGPLARRHKMSEVSMDGHIRIFVRLRWFAFHYMGEVVARVAAALAKYRFFQKLIDEQAIVYGMANRLMLEPTAHDLLTKTFSRNGSQAPQQRASDLLLNMPVEEVQGLYNLAVLEDLQKQHWGSSYSGVGLNVEGQSQWLLLNHHQIEMRIRDFLGKKPNEIAAVFMIRSTIGGRAIFGVFETDSPQNKIFYHLRGFFECNQGKITGVGFQGADTRDMDLFMRYHGWGRGNYSEMDAKGLTHNAIIMAARRFIEIYEMTHSRDLFDPHMTAAIMYRDAHGNSCSEFTRLIDLARSPMYRKYAVPRDNHPDEVPQTAVSALGEVIYWYNYLKTKQRFHMLWRPSDWRYIHLVESLKSQNARGQSYHEELMEHFPLKSLEELKGIRLAQDPRFPAAKRLGDILSKRRSFINNFFAVRFLFRRQIKRWNDFNPSVRAGESKTADRSPVSGGEPTTTSEKNAGPESGILRVGKLPFVFLASLGLWGTPNRLPAQEKVSLPVVVSTTNASSESVSPRAPPAEAALTVKYEIAPSDAASLVRVGHDNIRFEKDVNTWIQRANQDPQSFSAQAYGEFLKLYNSTYRTNRAEIFFADIVRVLHEPSVREKYSKSWPAIEIQAARWLRDVISLSIGYSDVAARLMGDVVTEKKGECFAVSRLFVILSRACGLNAGVVVCDMTKPDGSLQKHAVAIVTLQDKTFAVIDVVNSSKEFPFCVSSTEEGFASFIEALYPNFIVCDKEGKRQELSARDFTKDAKASFYPFNARELENEIQAMVALQKQLEASRVKIERDQKELETLKDTIEKNKQEMRMIVAGFFAFLVGVLTWFIYSRKKRQDVLGKAVLKAQRNQGITNEPQPVGLKKEWWVVSWLNAHVDQIWWAGLVGIIVSALTFLVTYQGPWLAMVKPVSFVIFLSWVLVAVCGLVGVIKNRVLKFVVALPLTLAAFVGFCYVDGSLSSLTNNLGQTSLLVLIFGVRNFLAILWLQYLKTKKIAESMRYAFYWAAATAMMQGYFTNAVYIPLMKDHFAGVWDRLTFSLGALEYVTCIPLGVAVGAVFAQGFNILKNIRESLKKSLKLSPLTFLYWFPCNVVIWGLVAAKVIESVVVVAALFNIAGFFWWTILKPYVEKNFKNDTVTSRRIDMGPYQEVRFSVKPQAGLSAEEQFVNCLKQVRSAAGRSAFMIEATVLVRALTNQEFAERRAALQREWDRLFAGRAPPVTFVAQPPLNGSDVSLECMFIKVKRNRKNDVRIEYKQLDGFRYVVVSYDGLRWVHAGGLTVDGQGDIEKQAEGALAAGAKILAAEGLDYAKVVRQWNYIEKIVGYNEAGRQHYQVFNDHRSKAYKGLDWAHSYPAATGIGMLCGGVVLKLTALDVGSRKDIIIVPIKNMLQVNAHEYAVKLLEGKAIEGVKQKVAPQFERAKVVLIKDGSVWRVTVYVSGTASIRGESTQFAGITEGLSLDLRKKFLALAPGRMKGQFIGFNEAREILKKDPELFEAAQKMFVVKDEGALFGKGKLWSIVSKIENAFELPEGSVSFLDAQATDDDGLGPNARLQTEMTVDNIEYLISEKNLMHERNIGKVIRGHVGAKLTDLIRARTFVKVEHEKPQVVGVCDSRLVGVPHIPVWADVCRPDLSMETEADGFVVIPASDIMILAPQASELPLMTQSGSSRSGRSMIKTIFVLGAINAVFAAFMVLFNGGIFAGLFGVSVLYSLIYGCWKSLMGDGRQGEGKTTCNLFRLLWRLHFDEKMGLAGKTDKKPLAMIPGWERIVIQILSWAMYPLALAGAVMGLKAGFLAAVLGFLIPVLVVTAIAYPIIRRKAIEEEILRETLTSEQFVRRHQKQRYIRKEYMALSTFAVQTDPRTTPREVRIRKHIVNNLKWFFLHLGWLAMTDDKRFSSALAALIDKEGTMVVQLARADTREAQLLLRNLFLASSRNDLELTRALSLEEYLALLSSALSVALRRPDADKIADYLDEFLATEAVLISPEAKIFLTSYLSVYRVKSPIKFAYCSSLFGGQSKYPPLPFGKDWLNKNTSRLFRELLSVNPKVQGFMVLVNDGDDTAAKGSLGRKTVDVVRGLLKDYRYHDLRDRIVTLELSQADKCAMNSVKHGALACAMRYAVDYLGADVVMYADGDMDARQAGVLIGQIANEGHDVAVGSTKVDGAVTANRRAIRKAGTFLYNAYIRLLLPQVYRTRDFQRAFKGFSARMLKEILPVRINSVSENGKMNISFDRNFIYDFTGDVEWIGRAQIAGYKSVETPIVWIDSPETSMVSFRKHTLPQWKSPWRVRNNQQKFGQSSQGPLGLYPWKIGELSWAILQGDTEEFIRRQARREEIELKLYNGIRGAPFWFALKHIICIRIVMKDDDPLPRLGIATWKELSALYNLARENKERNLVDAINEHVKWNMARLVSGGALAMTLGNSEGSLWAEGLKRSLAYLAQCAEAQARRGQDDTIFTGKIHEARLVSVAYLTDARHVDIVRKWGRRVSFLSGAFARGDVPVQEHTGIKIIISREGLIKMDDGTHRLATLKRLKVPSVMAHLVWESADVKAARETDLGHDGLFRNDLTCVKWEAHELGAQSIRCGVLLYSGERLMGRLHMMVDPKALVIYSCFDLKSFNPRHGIGRRLIISGVDRAYEEARRRGMSPESVFVYYTLGPDETQKIAEPVEGLVASLGFRKLLANDPLSPVFTRGATVWASGIKDLLKTHSSLKAEMAALPVRRFSSIGPVVHCMPFWKELFPRLSQRQLERGIAPIYEETGIGALHYALAKLVDARIGFKDKGTALKLSWRMLRASRVALIIPVVLALPYISSFGLVAQILFAACVAGLAFVNGRTHLDLHAPQTKSQRADRACGISLIMLAALVGAAWGAVPAFAAAIGMHTLWNFVVPSRFTLSVPQKPAESKKKALRRLVKDMKRFLRQKSDFLILARQLKPLIRSGRTPITPDHYRKLLVDVRGGRLRLKGQKNDVVAVGLDDREEHLGSLDVAVTQLVFLKDGRYVDADNKDERKKGQMLLCRAAKVFVQMPETGKIALMRGSNGKLKLFGGRLESSRYQVDPYKAAARAEVSQETGLAFRKGKPGRHVLEGTFQRIGTGFFDDGRKWEPHRSAAFLYTPSLLEARHILEFKGSLDKASGRDRKAFEKSLRRLRKQGQGDGEVFEIVFVDPQDLLVEDVLESLNPSSSLERLLGCPEVRAFCEGLSSLKTRPSEGVEKVVPAPVYEREEGSRQGMVDQRGKADMLSSVASPSLESQVSERAFSRHEAVGVLDSGSGGLDSARVLHEAGYRVVYLGDIENLPYGSHGREEVQKWVEKCVAFLKGMGAQRIFCACNTMAVNVDWDLIKERQGMSTANIALEMVAHVAYLKTSGFPASKIILAATPATIRSGYYQKELGSQYEVYPLVFSRLAQLIEEGQIVQAEHEMSTMLQAIPEIKTYDTLLLGCTHYPVLKEFLKANFPWLRIVDPVEYLEESLHLVPKVGLNGEGSRRAPPVFYTTKSNPVFNYRVQSMFPEARISLVDDIHYAGPSLAALPSRLVERMEGLPQRGRMVRRNQNRRSEWKAYPQDEEAQRLKQFARVRVERSVPIEGLGVISSRGHVYAPSPMLTQIVTSRLGNDLSGEVGLDVGTGSGVLGLMMLKRNASRVVFTDVKEQALECVRENVANLGLDADSKRFDCVRTDLFTGLGEEKFTTVVFTPSPVDGYDASAGELATRYTYLGHVKEFFRFAGAYLAPSSRIIFRHTVFPQIQKSVETSQRIERLLLDFSRREGFAITKSSRPLVRRIRSPFLSNSSESALVEEHSYVYVFQRQNCSSSVNEKTLGMIGVKAKMGRASRELTRAGHQAWWREEILFSGPIILMALGALFWGLSPLFAVGAWVASGVVYGLSHKRLYEWHYDKSGTPYVVKVGHARFYHQVQFMMLGLAWRAALALSAVVNGGISLIALAAAVAALGHGIKNRPSGDMAQGKAQRLGMTGFRFPVKVKVLAQVGALFMGIALLGKLGLLDWYYQLRAQPVLAWWLPVNWSIFSDIFFGMLICFTTDYLSQKMAGRPRVSLKQSAIVSLVGLLQALPSMAYLFIHHPEVVAGSKAFYGFITSVLPFSLPSWIATLYAKTWPVFFPGATGVLITRLHTKAVEAGSVAAGYPIDKKEARRRGWALTGFWTLVALGKTGVIANCGGLAAMVYERLYDVGKFFVSAWVMNLPRVFGRRHSTASLRAVRNDGSAKGV